MQLVDVSGDAGRIDSGNIFAQIGGNFGGYLSEHDSMTMTVRFLDENGDPIGDPVDVGGDQSRGGFTVIYQNVAFVNIPQGTRSFEVVLSADHETGSYTDGYADNLFITLSERVTESIAINLTPVNDAGVPQSDQFTTD
ncbi:MAG: hypothetical protein ACJ8EY_06565, partial [Sphingomicrobium sp.]